MRVLSRAACVAALFVATTAFGQFRRQPEGKPPPSSADGKLMKKVRAGQELYATLETTQGPIVIRLFSKEAPNTVANFVGLAAGEREFTHPATGEKMKKPYYDGTIFHRVIDGFMIQGGDPLGRGSGGPGYAFEYEGSERRFVRPGIVAMANRGARTPTNGSQFFITVAPTPSLNDGYTIFGEVVQGLENVFAISKVRTSGPPSDRPLENVVLKKVTISEKPPAKHAPAAAGKKKTKKVPAPADAPLKK